MAADRPQLIVHRRKSSPAPAAIVFIHGFGRNIEATWGIFPELLMKESRLKNWDVFSIGYSTTLAFDLAGVWSADPEIITMGGLIQTVTDVAPLNQYGALAILAHSMGGLLVQRALLSNPALQARVSHLLLFATPSAGLGKTSPFQFWKRQVRDLTRDSVFIRTLRQEWNTAFSQTLPFSFLAIAGDRDEFVPRTSSLDPFPEDSQRVVYGNHLELAKPDSPQHLSFIVAVRALTGVHADTSIIDTALQAVESRQFQHAIDTLGAHADELDDKGLVTLALALEGVGRQGDAIDILKRARPKGIQPLGVFAGRLKRRWLVEQRRKDAEQALALYRDGLVQAEATHDAAHASYYAINCAFMELAFGGDPTTCRDYASRALTHCASAAPGMWRYATEGEANIYLGNGTAVREAYARALAFGPTPRQKGSMYQQAFRAADLMGEESLAAELRALFGEAHEADARGTLYLEHIRLRNIRCFDDLSIDFTDGASLRKRTTILGDNSLGKSTLLRAIAIALCNEGDAAALIQMMPGPLIRTGQTSGQITIRLVAAPDGQRFTIEKRIQTETSGGETVRQTSSPTEIPWSSLFVCGYGTQRTAMATESHDEYKPGKAVETLFNANATLQNPEVVLLRQEPGLRLQLQKKLLDVMLLDSPDYVIEETGQGLRLRGPFGVASFPVLSDGYRSTAQWLIDMLSWLILAGRFSPGNEPSGILLIDEIEQHLHPRWQRHVLQRLSAQLPNMQIIATTHTPLVISGVADVESSSLLRLQADARGRIDLELIEADRVRGKRADQVLTDVFELITSRSPGSNRELEELARLRGLSTRTEAEEQKLAALTEGLQDALDFSDNPVERKVRAAISSALEQMVREGPDQPFDLETKRQLRELFGESKSS